MQFSILAPVDGGIGGLLGTVRVRCWPAGHLPRKYDFFLSLRALRALDEMAMSRGGSQTGFQSLMELVSLIVEGLLHVKIQEFLSVAKSHYGKNSRCKGR